MVKLKDSVDWQEWLDQQSEDAVVDYLMMQDNELAQAKELLEHILQSSRRHDKGQWLVIWQGNFLDNLANFLTKEEK